MDLGIKGKWALVCGASKGLGRACALSLAREVVRTVLDTPPLSVVVVMTVWRPRAESTETPSL